MMEEIDELDLFKELSTMGAGHTAASLSTMISKRVDIRVPYVMITTIDKIPKNFLNPLEVVYGIRINVINDKKGVLFTIFSQPCAEVILNLIDPDRSEEYKNDILCETGNILAGGFLSALANFFHVKMNYMPPILGFDMLSSLLDGALMESSMINDSILLSINELLIEGESCPSRVIFIPYFDFIEELKNKIRNE